MRVAVLGAGGPAGVNALRALREADHYCIAVDANPAHHVWCERYAHETHETLGNYGADVILAQPDPLALWLSQNRDAFTAKTFLPEEGTIWACQDKFSTALAWYRQSLREHEPVRVEEPWPDRILLAKDAFGLPFWLRATKGAGAKGAILVKSIEEGYHWLRFWQQRNADMRWVAEEYLPGRDYAWSSIWYEGELVTSFARERIEYLYPHLTPEGLTGTPTIARIVHDDRVNEIAEAAVRAIDHEAHGIFSVDLKEDIQGLPRPTEINAGRGFTTFGLWSTYDTNFLDVCVRLAASGPYEFEFPRYNALPDGLTLSRHIDCEYAFTHELVAA